MQLGNRLNRDRVLVVSAFLEFNDTIGQCEQSKITSYANILTRMVLCTSLTNDDIAGNSRLSAIYFNT